MTPDALNREVAGVRGLLETRLGIRGRDLDHQIRKAGRLLPRGVRRDARALAEAQSRLRAPRLAVQVDLAQARRAGGRVTAYLETVDVADRRRGRILGLLGVLSFNLLLFAALLAAFVAWRMPG